MKTLGIIGGGFAGVSMVAHLARLPWLQGLRVLLVDRGAAPALGTAYSTPHPSHLLNVPAGRMGALADDEGHFLAWLRETEPGATGDAFIPRRRYGEYLTDLLDRTRRGAPRQVEIDVRKDDAIRARVSATGAQIEFRAAESCRVDRVVLAIGNPPPGRPPFVTPELHDDPRYVPDPWKPAALDFPPTSHPVLLIGTGLTMVDVVLALRDRGHTGGFIAVSRRGLLPLSHRDWPRKPPVIKPPDALTRWNGSASAMLRIVRDAARGAETAGSDWRDVVNGLRPVTPDLWRRMPPRERARFVRHVRPFWETHRHRMSTRIAEVVNGMIMRRELQIVAGRVSGIEPGCTVVAVDVRGRDGRARRIEAGTIVNCTGPESDFARIEDRLIAELRASRLLVPDALGLGIRTGDTGALLNAAGELSDVLFTLGSPRRADLWESTAVPEIRQQADRLARHLHRSLHAAGGDAR